MIKKLSKKRDRVRSGGYAVMFFVLGAGVVALVVIGYLFLSKPYTPVVLTSSQIQEYMGNASVTLPDSNTLVILKNGKGEAVIGDEAATVTIMPPYFSVKTDDGYDLFGVMVYNTGGSGEFTNIVHFHKGAEGVIFKGSYPVGDRVKVTNIIGQVQSKDDSYSLTVNYLGRTDGKPMSDAPTEKETLTLIIRDGKLPDR